ncbi:hypothetical protein [Qipengyuania sp.]|uniref:DUF6950 family protein n=1 Tax=Qipengyuania sp. TaxID=2004515 RepID=UPI003518C226
MARDLMALVAYLDIKLAEPHDFDRNCCVRFVLGAVEAQFGSAPDLGTTWRTEAGAKRALVKLGGIEAATDRLFRRIEPARAQFGDIAGVVDSEGFFHVMVVEGQTLCSPGERRLERVSRREMIAAWSAEPLGE